MKLNVLKYSVAPAVVAAAMVWCAPAYAQESVDPDAEEETPRSITSTEQGAAQITVTATRAPGGIGLDVVPIPVVVTEAETASDRQTRDISDQLRDVPSIAVGVVPGQTQLRVRGAEANQVLVLIDGIEVSDPFAGEFDIGTLQAEIGSRTELVLGAQSALYGSDAIGGVLAYTTANGCNGTFDGYAEGGTNATFNASARLGVCGDGAELNLNATVVSTDGEANARGGTRAIGRDSYTLSGKGDVKLGGTLELRAVGRYVFTKGDFNDQDFDPSSPTFGLVIDSPDTRYENEALYALVGADFTLLSDRWYHDLTFQIADIRRDSFGPFGRSFGSEGERLKASYVSSLDFRSGDLFHTVTFAVDWEDERYRNTDPFGTAFTGTRSNENVGLVGEYELSGKGFLFAAALRHDINENFADATTFKLSGRVDLSASTALRGSVGSGIKNPGFYELFGFIDGRFIGNADLRPEKSTGWEIGLDQEFFAERAQVSLTYFDSELEDEIFTSFPAPTFVATPANRDTISTRRGIELSGTIKLSDTFNLKAAYTYLDAKEDGVTEVRRPESIASASLNWSSPNDDIAASLVIRHNGEAQDLAFTDPSFIPVRVTLDDYTLVNFYGEVDLADGVSLFGRVENLLDERFEQVFSFVSPGRTAIAGIRASF